MSAKKIVQFMSIAALCASSLQSMEAPEAVAPTAENAPPAITSMIKELSLEDLDASLEESIEIVSKELPGLIKWYKELNDRTIEKADSEECKSEEEQEIQAKCDSIKERFSKLSANHPKSGGLVPAKEFAAKDDYIDFSLIRHHIYRGLGVISDQAAIGQTLSFTNWVTEKMLQDVVPGRSIFLDVGCSYGFNTEELLKKGARWIIANDIDTFSLEVLANSSKINNNVVLSNHRFPEEFPKTRNLDGVLLSYVMHYFTPKQIQLTFDYAMSALKPGGKVYITALTPYSLPFSWYTLKFLRNLEESNPWPAEIPNTKEAFKETTGFDGTPKKVPGLFVDYAHPQFLGTLIREARRVGFEIEAGKYMPLKEDDTRENRFSDSLSNYRYNKEAVGLIVRKPGNL